MYKTIQSKWDQDTDMPARTFRLQMLRRVLDGTMYDKLPHPFHTETTGANEYVPLRDRRPSVRTNLCRTVVDDAVALLFSEGNFPAVELPNPEQKAQMKRLLDEIGLNQVMIDAATRGAVGSIAIVLKVLKGRAFLSVMDTDTLTPQWDPDAPDTLISVTEKYKVSGQSLSDSGYAIKDDDLGATFWFQRVWDTSQEAWYTPWKIVDKKVAPEIDVKRSVEHKLGFVPVAWVKNLPGGDGIDGASTLHPEAIDCQIEVDYQLSQAGRGLKFMSDPTLVIKEEGGGDDDEDSSPRVKGAANTLMLGAEDDAKLLEINGDGVAAVIDYVKHLREIALETMHGNRASNEKIAAAQSGRAMELMNQPLVWLADKLRISYGKGAIVDLVTMIIRASEQIALVYKDGLKVGKFDAGAIVSLRWPVWYAPTLQDMLNRATTLKTLCDAGLLSRETAIKILSAEYDIEDANAEKLLADADMAARNENAQVKAQINE